MNTAELKLQIIRRIMESDDADLAYRVEQLLSKDNNNTKKEPQHDLHEAGSTVIAYRADGQPLTVRDLKAEILEITDDGCKGSGPATHCSVKTRLKGIFWL